MKIPVFHDDQHGTAIIVGAAMLNGLRVVGKKIDEVKLVASGAGAAALACLDLLVDLGMPVENITVTDIDGVVYKGRNELMDPRKARYAQDTDARTLADVIAGADIFLGLSAPRRAEAGHGREDGAAAADPGARQPDAGDPAGRGEGGAAGRDHRHRPLGLSRTRSTTSSASPSSSAARSMSAPRTINEAMKIACVQRDRRPGEGRGVATSSPPPMAARRRRSAPTT